MRDRRCKSKESIVKNKLNEWYDWLVHHVPKTVERKVSNAFKTFKERIAGLWGKVTGKETLKDIVEEEAEKEHQEDQEEEQQQDNIDLTPQEHEIALKGAYRSFRSPGLPKTDVDTYIEKITPYMKTLIEQQIKDGISKSTVMHVDQMEEEKKWLLNLLEEAEISLEKFLKIIV